MPVWSDAEVAEHGGLVTVGMRLVARVIRREEDATGRLVYFQTERHGSILVKKGPRRTQVWVEHEAPRTEDGVVFRLLTGRDEEKLEESACCQPRNIFGPVTAEGHVIKGSNPSFKGSRFISASRTMKGIESYIRALLRPIGTRRERFRILMSHHQVATIKVTGLCERKVVCIDAEKHMRGLMPHNFAASAEEVLIDGEVPRDSVVELQKLDLVRICTSMDKMFFIDLHKRWG